LRMNTVLDIPDTPATVIFLITIYEALG